MCKVGTHIIFLSFKLLQTEPLKYSVTTLLWSIIVIAALIKAARVDLLEVIPIQNSSSTIVLINNRKLFLQKLKCTSHLLDKLVKRDQINTLVVNLYPGNEGYSLMLKGRNGSDSETIKLPYEVNTLMII